MSTHKFHKDFSVHPQISKRFQCPPTILLEIAVSTHKIIRDFSAHPQISYRFECPPTNVTEICSDFNDCCCCCCRRERGKPASCAGSPPAEQRALGSELCGPEPALPAFSTDAHPLKCVGAVSCLRSGVPGPKCPYQKASSSQASARATSQEGVKPDLMPALQIWASLGG